MRLLTKIFMLLFISISVSAQTFNGFGGAIPDDGTSIQFPITLSGLPITALDTSYGVESVCINITHTYDSDLDIWLICPDNTYIELSTGNGGNGQNYTNTCLNDTATSFISSAVAPFTGDFIPESYLYHANNGQSPNGDWKLLIHDTYAFADSGSLISWSITFGSHPGHPLVFTSSNLPILKINTNGQSIVDNPKIFCSMKVIDNGVGFRNFVSDSIFTFNDSIGIEVRGSSSQTFPKKSFSVETIDSIGVSKNVSLLGMPSENDWILNASYTDKSFMRNVLSCQLAREMGNYGSRTRFVELVINDQYQGIYIFMEKIKRDANRVNVSKMTTADTIGDALTGGYILKMDKFTGAGGIGWTTLYPPTSGGASPFIQYEYPKAADILPQQENYIHAYVDSFENVLAGSQFADPINGYAKYLAINSAIDYFLINELSKNVDGYRLSSYFYKKKDTKGGKLYMGPVWDYDIAWGNANYYTGDITSGWAYQFNYANDPFQPPFWWDRLLQDSTFNNAVRCRWESLRSTILSTTNLFAKVDSMALELNESQQRNFTVWPILGQYVWPNPLPLPTDYQGVVTEIKNWISNRASWLDANITGVCTTTGINDTKESILNISPNPINDVLQITFSDSYRGNINLQILNALGEELLQSSILKSQQVFNQKINLAQLKAGIYFAKIHSGKTFFTKKLIKQ